MNPLTLADIPPQDAFEAMRDELPATRASLLVDLAGDPPPRLDFAHAASAMPRDRVLEESANFRVIAPARP